MPIHHLLARRLHPLVRPLKGMRVLVTGASSGIGEATARALARSGAYVALLSERRQDLEAVVQSIEAEDGCAEAIHADLSRADQIDGLIARVEEQIGPLDALVNNAGVGMCC